MITTNKMKAKTLNILSGKGGSGKTVIALSISKIMSELGYKVLLVDCDIATHGATYFYENEIDNSNNSKVSLHSILERYGFFDPITIRNEITKVTDHFDFIPSTSNISRTDYGNFDVFKSFHKSIQDYYDIIIFDNQAGFSELSKICVQLADKNLIVLEADTISSSSVRVLYLQIGESLSNKNTWQIFNKLAEEERNIYNKIIGGTFFPNLPPIPFDWNVRASFALGQIPSIEGKSSAFGIGILRIIKIIFKQFTEKITEFENTTVGNWFESISKNLKNLEVEKELISKELAIKKSVQFRTRATLISFFITFLSIIIIMSQFPSFKDMFGVNVNIEIIIGIVGILSSSLFLFYSTAKVKQDTQLLNKRIAVESIEKEIEKYRTLIETDPNLKEYYNNTIEKIKDESNLIKP
jgi:cellulose biosynthesis protein BcsQ